ncbi:MAG: hypothetical protein HY827_09600 [Actinobacteria bacterium]|nr:hypothetical protein [Actinomycetota bacterium]
MKIAAKPNVSRAVDSINGLNARPPEGTTDDGWNVLVESLVIRDTLIDACRELVAATSQLENRLEALDPQVVSSNRAQALFADLKERGPSRAQAAGSDSVDAEVSFPFSSSSASSALAATSY